MDLLRNDQNAVHISEYQIAVMDRHLTDLNRTSEITHIGTDARILSPTCLCKYRPVQSKNLRCVSCVAVENCSACSSRLCGRCQQLAPECAVVCAGCHIDLIRLELIKRLRQIAERLLRCFKHVIFQNRAGKTSHFQAVVRLICIHKRSSRNHRRKWTDLCWKELVVVSHLIQNVANYRGV